MVLATAVLATPVFTGCAGPQVSEVAVPADRYAEAFDAAVDAARRAGMPATVRDRRSGVIETEPRLAGSVFEPWRLDNGSLDQALENTVNLQRRRARFVFLPADRAPPSIEPPDELTGPEVTGATVGSQDLTTHEGELRLVCIVIIERNHRTGTRVDTWTSRRYLDQATLGGDQASLPATSWTAVARDPHVESSLLEAVRDALAAGSASARLYSCGLMDTADRNHATGRSTGGRFHRFG
jgi:hypothetical protein